MKYKKVSSARESPDFLDFDYDDKDLYQVEGMSLEETKEKLEWRKRALECEQIISYGIENWNDITFIHEK